MARSAIPISIILVAIAFQPARGDITGFGDGSGYTLNHSHGGSPTIDSGTLTLTHNSGESQAASAFYKTAQGTGSFSATFTYQASGVADGVTFVIQHDPAGPAALGGFGSGLGYAPEPSDPSKIINSVGLEINLYSFTHSGTLLETQGVSGIFNYLSSLPVDFNTGDPFKFMIAYDATAQTLSETIVDTVSSTTYTHTFTGVNIASEVGSSSAYVGFTGGTGGLSSTQTISDFQFHSAVPEPTSMLLMGLGLGVIAIHPRTRRSGV